jgi:hypothetical protein
MDPATAPDGLDRLGDLRDLLAGLGARLVGGGMLAWASPGDIDAMPGEVFGVVREAGLLGDGDPRRQVAMPADADALSSLLWEVDERAAIDILTSLAGGAVQSRMSRRQRRRYPDDPRDIFQELASMTGPDTRWWTNTDLTRWNPITQHTFDAIVVGAGNGIIVTLIAVDSGS